MLIINSEEELYKLLEKASSKQIKFSSFREPDINNELTSIVLEPGEKSKKLCSNLKLAFKDL